MRNERSIYVYADFLSHQNELIGKLYASEAKGREFYSFEYDPEWLAHEPALLDPDLQLYKGRQYVNDDKNIFGLFADSCPDRWGRHCGNWKPLRRHLRMKIPIWRKNG